MVKQSPLLNSGLLLGFYTSLFEVNGLRFLFREGIILLFFRETFSELRSFIESSFCLFSSNAFFKNDFLIYFMFVTLG